MNSENTVNLLLVAISGVAMLGVMLQWLRSDEAAVALGAGLRHSALEGTLGSVPEAVAPRGDDAVSARAQPVLLADDETALSRLCFAWGAGGTVLGLGVGAALSGFVGALLGSVVCSALAIAAVVVFVIVHDRKTEEGFRLQASGSSR